MTCEGPRDLSCQNIVKKRKSLSVDILCRASTPCRRMGPSLACPDVSDETPERDGDIGSILDSRCRQISRTWMLQQLLFSNEHQSWPALKLRRVFAQHFLSFGVFSWRRGPTLANIVSGGNGILARMVCCISVAEICPI